jgi:hypothetical protein
MAVGFTVTRQFDVFRVGSSTLSKRSVGSVANQRP